MRFAAFLPYLIVGVGLALGRLGLRPAMRVWGICMIGALSGLAIAITFVVSGQIPSWYLVAVSSLPFVVVFIMVIKDLSYPLINDLATDLDSPIRFEAALDAAENAGRDMTYSEAFKAKVRKSYPFIQPLKLIAPADQVFDRVVHCANQQHGWRIVHQDTARRTVEAEAVTHFMGFVDDVIIQVSDQGRVTRVDMRSKSREGLVDGGKNAKRIREFLSILRQCSERSHTGDPGRADTAQPINMQRGALQ